MRASRNDRSFSEADPSGSYLLMVAQVAGFAGFSNWNSCSFKSVLMLGSENFNIGKPGKPVFSGR